MKVLMPKFWTEINEPVIGYTDGVDTYCCCLTPAWFVEVPEFEYSGYFNIKDLTVIN